MSDVVMLKLSSFEIGDRVWVMYDGWGVVTKLVPAEVWVRLDHTKGTVAYHPTEVFFAEIPIPTAAVAPPDRRKRIGKMLVGNTEAETLELNGWKIGDVLVGIENGQEAKILITAIGDELFLCRWLKGHFWGTETGSTTLRHRHWRKHVGTKDSSSSKSTTM